MPNLDLETMSLSDLKQLQKDLDKAITDFEERRRKEAIALLEATAAEHGFRLSELIGGKSPAPKKLHPPKYAHPDDRTRTWSGRGRQPTWLKDALAEGRALEDYLIV